MLVRRATVLLFAFVACAPNVMFVPTNASPRPLYPRPPETVQVFSSSVPTKPFVEVGIITAETAMRGQHGVALSSAAELIEALREKGAELGCDALIVRPGSGDSHQATCLAYTGQ
jgi:hypothetical protein